MADRHSKATRSRNMSAVKGKNTTPEMRVRRLLHSRGYRYRLHCKHVKGKPDIVFKKYKAVIFIHGCFWHYHGCRKTNIPEDNHDFWKEKLEKNKARDQRVVEGLIEEGWRVLIIWECALKGKNKLHDEDCFKQISDWIKGTQIRKELSA